MASQRFGGGAARRGRRALHDLLVQPLKDRGAEKFPQRDVEAVTELFHRDNGHISPPGVQQTVHCGGRHPSTDRQFVGADASVKWKR